MSQLLIDILGPQVQASSRYDSTPELALTSAQLSPARGLPSQNFGFSGECAAFVLPSLPNSEWATECSETAPGCGADDGASRRDRLRNRRQAKRFNGPPRAIASRTIATVMAAPMASGMMSMSVGRSIVKEFLPR